STPRTANQAPVSMFIPLVLPPRGGPRGAGVGTGAGDGVGLGIGMGALEASCINKEDAGTSFFKLRSISWPFTSTNDSDVFTLRTVTLPLIVRSAAAPLG